MATPVRERLTWVTASGGRHRDVRRNRWRTIHSSLRCPILSGVDVCCSGSGVWGVSCVSDGSVVVAAEWRSEWARWVRAVVTPGRVVSRGSCPGCSPLVLRPSQRHVPAWRRPPTGRPV
jgi:hypothetical protein